MIRRAGQPGSARPIRSGGFTLIETIATVVVLSILGTSASMLLLNSTDAYVDAANQAQLNAEASITLDRIVRELRSIPLDPAASVIAPDIDSVTGSSIDWRDADGDAWGLELSGTDLMLVIDGGSAQVLQTDVAAFDVQGYDESNIALSSSLSGVACDSIRRVQITLSVQRNGVSESVRTKMFLRSTMTGAEVDP